MYQVMGRGPLGESSFGAYLTWREAVWEMMRVRREEHEDASYGIWIERV